MASPVARVPAAVFLALALALAACGAAVAHDRRVPASNRGRTPTPLPSEEVDPEVDTYVSPRMRKFSQQKPIEVEPPKKRTKANEVPGPSLPLVDIDPSQIPLPPPDARRRLLVLPKDEAAQRRILEPSPLERPKFVDPLVKRVFPGLVRSEYAGDTDCLGCHGDKKDDWRRSIYGLIHYDRAIPPERRGCEGCHGPGAEHVVQGGEKDWIVNPKKLDRRSVSRLCMSCHAEERLIRRQAWHFTDHHESHVTCLDCHSVHRPKAEKALSDEPNRLCLKCHADQKSYFTMTSHHPVKAERVDALRSLVDGKVRCIDCHQAYSAKNPRMLRGDKSEACLACHPEFRGPFLFQHGGGNELLSDGCATCHIGHGSPNRYLLKRPDRTLCVTCHTDRIDHNPGPSCFSTGGCHNDIHGSNTNRWFIGGFQSITAPARFDPMVGDGP